MYCILPITMSHLVGVGGRESFHGTKELFDSESRHLGIYKSRQDPILWHNNLHLVREIVVDITIKASRSIYSKIERNCSQNAKSSKYIVENTEYWCMHM